jgi:hypothetical protein
MARMAECTLTQRQDISHKHWNMQHVTHSDSDTLAMKADPHSPPPTPSAPHIPPRHRPALTNCQPAHSHSTALSVLQMAAHGPAQCSAVQACLQPACKTRSTKSQGIQEQAMHKAAVHGHWSSLKQKNWGVAAILQRHAARAQPSPTGCLTMQPKGRQQACDHWALAHTGM